MAPRRQLRATPWAADAIAAARSAARATSALYSGGRLVAIDCETTGLSVDEGHRIVALGALDLDTGRARYWVFNPERQSDFRARRAHGLDDAYLSIQPRFDAHAGEIEDFLGDAGLVAHNAAFDRDFIAFEMLRAGRRMPVGDYYCTMEIAEERFSKRLSLARLLAEFGVDLDASRGAGAHHALGDAEAALVALACLGGASSPPSLSLGGERPENEAA